VITQRPSAPRARRGLLEPVERHSEVLFGLIMVLTFTGSLSAAGVGREEVRTMLVGALGCNVAWGIIDAIMYLMACLAEKAQEAPGERPRLAKDEWLGALSVFAWVVASALPVVAPFLVVADPMRALRASNAIAVALLFVTGYAFGRSTGLRPLATGLAMVLIGMALVGLTMALGG